MTIHLNRNGNWYALTDTDIPYIKDGNTWKTPASVWVKDNNIWKQQWPSTGGTPIPPPEPAPGTVSISNMSLSGYGISYNGQPGGAYCSYSLKSDRSIMIDEDGVTNIPAYWLSSNGSVADFQAMATGTASGTKNTWIDLNTNPVWSLSAGVSIGAKSAYIELSIRDKASQVVLDVATINFDTLVEAAPVDPDGPPTYIP